MPADVVRKVLQVSERPVHVLIIGAGLSGTCLAHGLKRAGLSVAVYEREAARGDGFFGCRLAIGPRGSKALRDALPPDLYQTFLATCAAPPRHLAVYSDGLDELLSIRLPASAGSGDGSATGMHYASAMTLRQLMLTGVEDVVHFGKELTHYEQRPGGRIAAFFADGSSAVGDVLVGADGRCSRVRRQYLPHAGVLECGPAAVFGQVPLSDAAMVLPGKMLEGLSVVSGRDGSSLMTQPMEFKWDAMGEPKPHVGRLDAALIKTWPGLSHDRTVDHVLWGLMVPSWFSRTEPACLAGDRLVDAVMGLTRPWHTALRALVKLTDPATAAATPALVSDSVARWQATNVTLLGDALVCRVPDAGEGANAAFRAAGILCRLLAEAVDRGRPVVSAINDYEAATHRCGRAASSAYTKCLTRQARATKPVIGPVLAAGTRMRLRVADRVPRLKARVASEYRWLQGGSTA
ncbi:NAD(P)/FAD-dependent oxidoreductase [Actinoallomurus liliacearum]|uniref:FAD-dependent oxidoreductase n=1 Tax=Actinoallomurus liliacearum TaxID=1080073 RepID=UPI0031E8F820